MTVGEEILHALIEVIEDLQCGGTLLPRSVHEVPDIKTDSKQEPNSV